MLSCEAAYFCPGLAAVVMVAAAPPALVLQADDHAAAYASARELSARILQAHSATAVLEQWCAERGMAAIPKLVADVTRKDHARVPATIRRQLMVDANEPVAYRHVRLRCGDHILSDAENWFVPSRLTPVMMNQLEASDASFGTIVRDLHPTRKTFSARMLWSGRGQTPHRLFRHRALLLDERNIPFSKVSETYLSGLLDRSGDLTSGGRHASGDDRP
jgi:chorismate-pyruvate lyase